MPIVKHFRGINTTASVMEVGPDEALDCLNVFAPEGALQRFAQQNVLADLGNAVLVRSIGMLDFNNLQRLVLQQGGTFSYIDLPATPNGPLAPDQLKAPTVFTQQNGGVPNAARCTYAQSNGILHASTNGLARKFLPGDPMAYLDGILASAKPPVQVVGTGTMGVTSIQRAGGVVTIVFATAHGTFAGQPLVVDNAGPWPATFAGNFTVNTVVNATTLTYKQPGLPDDGPYGPRATYPGGLTPATGYQWGFSYGSTKTGHWSSLSVLTANWTGTGAPAWLAPPTSDPQVDQVAWFRNGDGQGVWYLVDDANGGIYPIGTPFIDTTDDATLYDSGVTAPYDNGVSPAPKYILNYAGRIIGAGLTGDSTGVRYTGYDTIAFGVPQESWCQYNEIRLGDGQSVPNGLGLLRYGGVVFFCANKNMFLMRGTLSDVTVSAPQPLQYTVELLPWQTGCFSHFSVQSTSKGVIWLDDSFQLQFFDGFYPPAQVAPNLARILKRMTPGLEDTVASCYFKIMNHEYYGIAFPVDGSNVNNMFILIDLDPKGPGGEAWPTNHSVIDLLPVQLTDGSNHLLTAQSQLLSSGPFSPGGYISELFLDNDTTNGVQNQGQPQPGASLMPGCRWRSGYAGATDQEQNGESSWESIKSFRSVLYSTSLPALKAIAYVVDGDYYTFENPLIHDIPFNNLYGAIQSKGRGCSVETIFPDDGPAAPIQAIKLSMYKVGMR